MKRNINNDLAVLPSHNRFCHSWDYSKCLSQAFWCYIQCLLPQLALFLLWLGKMAKSLFIFLFILFSFGLTIQGKSAGKVLHDKYHMSQSHTQDITGLYHMMRSHDGCGKTVHRPCSSCISSVENLMGTPLSSPCQLRLGGWLSHPG